MADIQDSDQKTGLLLIGIGPGDVALATSEALDAAKTADYRRYEAYTASVSYTHLTLPTKA